MVVLTYVSTWLCLCQSCYGNVKRGGLTYVSTWLCPCHFTGLTQGEEGGGGGVCSHMSLPCLALVTPLIFAQSEKGWFNICLYLAFPLSLNLSYRKVRKGWWFEHMSLPGSAFVTPFILWQGERGGGGLTYVSTWLCLCHSIHLMAR